MNKPAWKIKSTLFIVLSISLILTMGIGAFHYFNITRIIKEMIFSEINIISETKAEVIETYISGFEHEAHILSDVLALKLTTSNPDLTGINSLLSSVAARAPEIAHVDFISPEGVAIASSDPNKIGEAKTQKATYKEGKKALFFNNLHLSSGGNKPAFGISLPVHDTNNQLLGVVLVDVNADKLYRILRETPSLNDIGEIFLVNKDNLLVSPSKYLSDTFLKKEVTNKNVTTCSTHEHDTHSINEFSQLSLYEDLSGNSVLGNHVYMPKREWCLITEVDENEYLTQPILRLILVSGMGILLSFSLFFIITLSILQIIIQPIQTLRQAMVNVSKGQFNQKIDTGSTSEIGDLGRMFNSMTEQVTNYFSNLQKEVKQKIDELATETETRKATEKKLETTIEDLQRTKNIVSDRELKMLILQKEIDELKKSNPTSS